MYPEHQIRIQKVTAAVRHFKPHLLTGVATLYAHIYMTYTHIVRYENASTHVSLHCFGSSLLALTLSISVILLAQLELHPPSQADTVEQMLLACGHDARLSNRQDPDREEVRQNIHALAKYNHMVIESQRKRLARVRFVRNARLPMR